ncbi:MAG: hypothetical protein EXS01_03960 [Phycisphaerales bacterium]|nr:hypothetical protein [Phycisphaerales bacterium]
MRVASIILSIGTGLIASAASAAITLIGPTTIPLNPLLNPTHAAVADVDGNGVVDIVVSCRDVTGRMAFLRGIGGGLFAPPEIIEVGAPTDWVEVRDIDGDGTPDLLGAVRSNHGRIALLRGLGGGQFAAPTMTLAERNPAGMIVRDLNADGALDVALVNYTSGSVEIWLGDAAGNFHQSQFVAAQPWATAIAFPFSILAADFDGDGDLDLATASIGGGAVAMLRNDGSGHFAQGQSFRVPTVGEESVAIANIAASDIDRDGDIDLLSNGLLLNSPNVTVVWVNDGTGKFAEKLVRAGGAEGYSWTVNTGDMDGDGDDDVLMGSALPGRLTIAEVDGNASGSFVQLSTRLGGSFLRDMTIIDIDNDGDRDVVAVDIAMHTVMIYRNTAGGVAGDGDAPPSGTLPSFRSAAAATQWLASWQDEEGSLAGAIPAFCGAGAGLCEEPHDTPGCVRTLCCEAVCKFNPLCCEIAWDQACVDAEDQLCDDFNCPSAGACDAFHAGPGCQDEACCGFLCEFDPFCCYGIWDSVCAREATTLCGAEPCSIGHDSSAIVLDEICYQRLDEGCNKVGSGSTAALCGQVFESTISTESTRDTDWFSTGSLACGGATATIETEFPMTALVVRGPCDGPLQLRAMLELDACSSGSLAIEPPSQDPNQEWIVISAANADRPFRSAFPCDVADPNAPPPDPDDPPYVPSFFGLHYRVSFAPRALAGDINGDGFVDGLDLTTLLSGWGSSGDADIDGNGVVDGADLATLLSNWGAGSP